METVVELENFTGPLDLLLFLVRQNEVDIHDIRVADIAGQYLRVVTEARKLDMEVAGEFLLMAATLAEMKSRSLVPSADDEEAEEAEEGKPDPRLELIRQLLRFRYYKERATLLEQRMLQRQMQAARPRNAARHLSPVQVGEEVEEVIEADVFTLAVVYRRLKDEISSLGPKPIVYDDIPIEDKIEEVMAALQQKPRVLFDDLVHNPNDPIEMVTTLMAVLELVKQRLAAVRQLEGMPSIVILRPEDAPPIALRVLDKPEPPLPGTITIAAEERRDPMAEALYSAVSGAQKALQRIKELRKMIRGDDEEAPVDVEEQAAEAQQEAQDVAAIASEILDDLASETSPESAGLESEEDESEPESRTTADGIEQ